MFEGGINLVKKILVTGILFMFLGMIIVPNVGGNNENNYEELVVTVTTDKEIYFPGEPVTITISVTNYGPNTTLTFPDTQLADLKITKPNGLPVYLWGWHFGFFQVLTDLSITQGETKVLLRWEWYKLRDFYPFFPLIHFPVLPGKYYINGWMVGGLSHPVIEGEQMEVTLRLFKFI
jgi:hypothetical protein